MALAVLACLGSLLGWQFTLAQTGKVGRRRAHVPAMFSKVNSWVRQSPGCSCSVSYRRYWRSRRSRPPLSEQFSALVNLAVVTNVVPYVVALSH